MKKIKKGFTLVELMVVIAIIGILTTVVMTNMSQTKTKARDAKRASDIAQIQLALELYFNRCNKYPNTLTSGANNGCPSGVTLGLFLSPIPVPPPGTSNVAYSYASLGANCTSYHLGATMESQNSSFQSDANYNSSSVTLCPGSGNGFDGGASLLYDVRS
jgi:general secretion pathway protein G